MCLAGVETSVHLDSLKVWSSFDAPGVKSRVLKIREQRITLLFSGLLIGRYWCHISLCLSLLYRCARAGTNLMTLGKVDMHIDIF